MHMSYKNASFVQLTITPCTRVVAPAGSMSAQGRGLGILHAQSLVADLKGLVQIGLELCTIHAGVLDKQC